MQALGEQTVVPDAGPGPSRRRWPQPGRWLADAWYVGAVVVGGILIVAAAFAQPYNQNEIVQITPYSSSDPDVITSGTRQPPLDPLLGALVQHLLGEGALQQRLVSVLAGLGTLALIGLLLRAMVGWPGALALSVLATQPLMVQYSAYARPYALPVFLAVLFVFAARRWIVADRRRLGWLALAVVAAAALAKTRVPEPNVFLLSIAVVLAWYSRRGRLAWSRTGPLIGVALGAVALIGYPTARSLASTGLIDLSIANAIDRFGSSFDDLVNRQLPAFADFFPWWPLTLAVVVVAFVLPGARRRLLVEWGWMWWPLFLAPLAFFLAYEFFNPIDLVVRPYRDRYAYFFLPALTLLFAALATTVSRAAEASRHLRIAIGALLLGALVSQLPATATVLSDDTSPDFVGEATVLSDQLPEDALVAYVAPARLDQHFRQDFMLLQVPEVAPAILDSRAVASDAQLAPRDGPVFVVVLDGECVNSVYCDKAAPAWNQDVPGWSVLSRYDHFTLYGPDDTVTGRSGLVEAYESFGAAFGPVYGMNETLAAAALFADGDDDDAAQALVRERYAMLGADDQAAFRAAARKHGLYPFD